MTKQMEGKIAVVTGASEGIGLACATAMLEQGARVVAIGRSADKLAAAFDGYGDAVVQMPADLLDDETCETLVDRILEKVDHIDIFHANAGMYVGGDLTTNSLAEIANGVKLNLTVPMLNVRSVLPHMVERGGGQILITSSLAAHLDTPWEPVYASVKSGVNKFARITHDQYCQHGIRISTISPGPTKTALFEGWPEDKKKAMLELGIMEPSDVAEMAAAILTRPTAVYVADVAMKPTTFTLGGCS